MTSQWRPTEEWNTHPSTSRTILGRLTAPSTTYWPTTRDSPLEIVGLTFGDAKIIRTPGGRVTTSALAGCIAGVHLLNVNRIMVIPHSRCAMAAADDDVIIEKIRTASGADASWVRFGASADQRHTLHRDTEKLRNHPLIGDRAVVGGFYYDVDTGLLERWD
jgi:carbonic anhydrase